MKSYVCVCMLAGTFQREAMWKTTDFLRSPVETNPILVRMCLGLQHGSKGTGWQVVYPSMSTASFIPTGAGCFPSPPPPPGFLKEDSNGEGIRPLEETGSR